MVTLKILVQWLHIHKLYKTIYKKIIKSQNKYYNKLLLLTYKNKFHIINFDKMLNF